MSSGILKRKPHYSPECLVIKRAAIQKTLAMNRARVANGGLWPSGTRGRKHSEETLKKMRDNHVGMTGRTLSLEHKEHLSVALSGISHQGEWARKISEAPGHSSLEARTKKSLAAKKRVANGTHNFWKGGLTSESKKLRESIEYRLWREAVFARDSWTCQDCKVRGGELCPHHIKPWALFPELRLAIDNGLTLCHTCHKKTDTFGWKLHRHL